VLKVFMDESGIHEDAEVVCVGAYVARPKTWRDWTKRWNIAKKPIKVYHAADAQNLHGEFEGWSEGDRDELVKRVLPVIAKTEGMPGVVIGIHLREYNEKVAGHNFDSIFGTPYATCFQWVIQTIMMIHESYLSSERVAFYHEINDYQGEALESFTYVKQNYNHGNAQITMAFGSKDDCTPLQAADVLAYEGNKRLRDPSRPERRPWKVLNHDQRLIAKHYGRSNMADLIRRLEKIQSGDFDSLRRELTQERQTILRQIAP
jgi:hypothetical protein